jgi:PAS domain S-box-containing protein
MRDTQTTADASKAKPHHADQPVMGLWIPVIGLMLFALAIAAGSYLVFELHKENKRIEKQHELGGIAELKIQQITTWMTERRGDAQIISDDVLFTAEAYKWLQHGGPQGESKAKLLARLSSMQRTYSAYGYHSISLLDEQAVLRLSSSVEEVPGTTMEKNRVLESMRTEKSIFSDILRKQFRSGEMLEIELITPLILTKKGRKCAIGAILFRIDPHRFLFPLIQHWPTPSPSAETLLVRREGDMVVFLNELRHQKNTELTMRRPLSPHLPASMAVTGTEGVVEGVDYRGVPVVGVLLKVPGTSWFMVSKIDRAEIYAPINKLAEWILLMLLSLISAGSVLAVLWWKNEKRHENEILRQKRFVRQVIDSDPNLIFVKDAEGRYLLANESMAKSYGQTAVGILGKSNADFVTDPELSAAYEQASREVLENRRERVAVEAAVLSDGQKHWFKTIRKPLEQYDGSVSVLTIAVDITDIKQAEEEQMRLNRALRLLSSCNQAIMHGTDEHAVFDDICKLVVETGGYSMAWVGLAEYDQERSVRPVASYGANTGYLDSANISWADTERGGGPTGIAMRTRMTQVNHDFLTNPLMALWREAAIARGFQSSAAIPFFREGDLCGTLTIYAARAHAFNDSEVALLEELAENLSFGITALRSRTEREQMVESLSQSEEQFRFLTENASDMIFLWSQSDGRYDYVSPASTRLTGYTPEEFYDTPSLLHDIGLPVGKHNAQSTQKINLSEETSPHFEYCITHKSGEKRWLSQRDLPVWAGEGMATLVSIQGVVSDITERKKAEAQLENERIRLHTLVQTIPDMVWLKDADGVFLICNPLVERLYGTKEADLIGKTDYDFADTLLADYFRSKDLEAMAAGKPSINEEWLTYADNNQRVLFETIKAPMRDEDGVLIGVMGIARDITERKRTEDELRFKNTLLTTEHEASIEGILIVGGDGKIVSYNRRFADIWRISDDITNADLSWLAKKSILAQLVEPDLLVEKVRHLYGSSDETYRDEFELCDGRVIEYYTTPMTGPQQEQYGRIWYLRDLTEQKLAAKNLAKSYIKLKRLALRMENAREDERAKLALNLHDEMGATLAALKMRVDWLASRLPAEMPLLQEEARHIDELVSNGIKTMHKVVNTLRPDLLGEEGFAAAIEVYVNTFRRHAKIECLLVLPKTEFMLDTDQSVTLFRILQESLNNVLKHAHASRVSIVFTNQSKSLRMVVKDNGVGFDPYMKKEHSLGLLGIRERALIVGGKARISSTPGKGTRISVSMPYPARRIGDLE